MKDYARRMLAALERGRRFVTHDVWRLGRPGEEIPHGLITKHVRVAILVFRNLTQNVFWLRASALAFTTILSIVPFFAVMFYIIQAFNLEAGLYDLIADRVASRLESQPKSSIPSDGSSAPEIPQETPAARPGPSPSPSDAQEGTEKAGGESEDREPPLKDVLVEWMFQNVAQKTETEKGEVLQDPVRALISFAERSANPHAIGIPGLVLVLTAVFGLMINIETAFNAIWGVKPTRSWYRIFSDYVIIMLLLPFIAASVLGLTVALQGRSVGILATLLRGIRYIVIWASFTMLYLIVPNARVQIRYALIGGIVAGTAWIANAWVYVSLVSLAAYKMIYAGFAQFPLLVMWIYVSWVIMLFGAQLSFAYQNERTFALERLAASASYAYREAVGLCAMVEMARRFDAGLPGLEPSASAETWNVPTRLMNETLDQLETAGLVRRCATEPVTYLPARSLDKITLHDIVAALREAGQEPSALREDKTLLPLLDRIHRVQGETLSRDLASLIRELELRIPSLDGIPPDGPPKAPAAREYPAEEQTADNLDAPSSGTGGT